MKRSAALSAILLLLASQAPSASAQPRSAQVLAEAQLLGAIKLWGDIKLFDPRASDASVDWDAAFLNAEPAIIAAKDKKSYRAAIAALLAPLHDPATRVQSDEDASNVAGRIGVSSAGAVAVITIPRDVTSDEDALMRGTQRAVAVAAKSRDVLFDLRGVSDAYGAGGGALLSLFAADSPILQLVAGTVLLPRVRTRSYVGYPNQMGGYSGYTAIDQASDPVMLDGKWHEPRRFGFLVDASTALPPMAVGMAMAGQATIYSTGGQPSILSTSAEAMTLPYDIGVEYRTDDLADIAPGQAFATVTVRDVAGAAAHLESSAPQAARYAPASASAPFADDHYASAQFPGEAMRMLGVARIYNVIRYFSPYTALMDDDWDGAARAAIADERVAGSARDYVLGLMKFYAHLHDSHGFIWNATVGTEFAAGPPFRARYLQRQAVVVALYGGAAAQRGLRVGDVIDAVDGVPVRAAMNRIEKYICSSTPQSADYAALRTAGRPSIFTGRAKTTLTLRFHHPSAQVPTSATFARDVFPEPPPRPSPKYFGLPGNVGYVDFDRLEVSEVDAMFEALKNTRAIVFDNRGYPNGAAWPIAPRLTTANSVRAALFNTPLVLEPIDIDTSEVMILPTYHEFYQMLDRASGPRYLRPTVMLVDERTISQAEHSALFFHAANRTRFVGTPTQGANGDVTTMVAPGALLLGFSGEGVRYPDGRQLQRVGVVPDVRIEPTASDIASRNDVVLQRGLDEALRLAGADARLRKAALQREVAREKAAR